MTDFDDPLQALRLRFHARLRDLAQWLGEGGGPLDRPAIPGLDPKARLQDEAHKLAGIGASLGYPEISLAARELEVLIAESRPQDDIRAAIHGLLAAIQIVLDRAEP